MVDYRWNLAPLNLQPGTQVTFYATASDYLPQTGKSEPRRLIVVTPDELRDRMADRERLIVAELERALKMQRGCRDRSSRRESAWAICGGSSSPTSIASQAAEHAQREVDELLTSRGEGVPMHVLALLADLENNGIDNADARQRMNGLLEELDRLDREVMPPLGRELTAAVKTAQVDREGQGGDAARSVRQRRGSRWPPSPSVRTRSSPRWNGRSRQLGRWDSYRRLHREHCPIAPRSGGRGPSHVGSRPPHVDPRAPRPSAAGRRRSARRRRPAA